ncbi:glycosyltransferase [Sporosalibacterium faouarense]|uniref:glycosyltransferase n=1 Tax=Sporosalibacterium faouarense TaxID=516123 RepID=UPI0024348225|nr:glycosyltransferase [Sporosalibacterium faouarense]
MIVKNEKDTLGRCLESVKDLVDEIIIVDTGSTDNTKEIANDYTDKVFDFEWIDDFSAARNYSFSKATMDYILWLDADDVILEEDRKKFLELKKTLAPDIDAVYMKYNLGCNKEGKPCLSYYRERLSKRAKNYKWIDPIHEYLAISGKKINTDICITHKKIHPNPPGRNMKIFEKMIKENRKFSPRNLYYYARELFFNGKYNESIEYYEKFLETGRGWIEDNISACFDLSQVYKNIGDSKERLRALFRSFEYDTPRAEVCCEIGYYYKELRRYNKAIFWFDLAMKLEKPKDSWGFIRHDSWDYIPLLELCVCYDKIGNTDKAIKCNELAEKIKPDSRAVQYNKKYFESLKSKS